MLTPQDHPLSTKPLPPAPNGYALWKHLRAVTRDTARDELPPNTDLEACRAIAALAEAIERGVSTAVEEAQAAVRSILANYQRSQFADLGEATHNACALMMRRPPGVVAMLADPEFGIGGQERYPPTLAQFTNAIDRVERSILLAAQGARRALGLGGRR